MRIENKGAVKSAIAQALVHGLEQPPRFVKKSPLAKRGLQLMTKSDCLNCHQWTRPLVAPTFFEIAERYRDDKTAPKKLADKVLQGGVGEAKFPWHRIPSTPPEARHGRCHPVHQLN